VLNSKTFMFLFIVMYVVLSLPVMLGIGYVIDWIPEASLSHQLREYVIKGLTNGFQLKVSISVIVSLILMALLPRLGTKKAVR